METLKFELTIDETNVILEALGSMPFVKVHGIINKIQQQAAGQLNDNKSAVSVPHGENHESKHD